MSIISRFYHKNLLKRAENGLGDGTKYATGTSATPDQTNKKITVAGLSIVADLGGDIADLFNGYLLCFAISGNKYHIVDYETGGVFHTYETPSTDDTGACEVRLTLFMDRTIVNASYPIHLCCDGIRSTMMKGQAANKAMLIRVFAPNFVPGGGFEEQAAGNVGGDWTADTIDWQIISTGALRGSRSVEYTKDGTDSTLYVPLSGTLEKGKTYRLIFLGQAITANPSGAVLQLHLRQRHDPYDDLDSDWDTDEVWEPTLTTTAAWFEKDFVPEYTTDIVSLYLEALGSSGSWGSCTGFRLDELYIFEKIETDRFIVLGHNWDGAVWKSGESAVLYGERLNDTRTNAASGDWSTLVGGWTQNGSEPIIKSFSAGAWPVYHLKVYARSWLQYEAEEIFIGPAMAFVKQMDRPFDPDAEIAAGIMNETSAGRTSFYKEFHRGGPYEIALSNVSSAFYENLKDWWEGVGRNKWPFFFCFDEENNPEKIRFVRSESDWLFPYDPVTRQGALRLREEL